MTIPSLPSFYNMQYTDEAGMLSPDGYLYNDQTFQTLNLVVTLINSLVTSSISSANVISNNGVVFPSKTSTQITALEPTAALGTVWFNTSLAKLQVKTAAGTVETITST